MTVSVVTDSTAYLPRERVGSYGLRVVPLHVRLDEVDSRHETVFGPEELTAVLESGQRVTTSGATVPEFVRAYRDALSAGASGILSVHLSGELSGTCDAARVAAREVDPDRIRVLDSRSVAMGLGFAVLAAAARAARGAPLPEVAAVAERTALRGTVLFSVQTIEYLRRGGRIGAGAALLGTALAVKPLLRVRAGLIEATEKVRTTGRAVSRLEELAVGALPDPVDSEPVALAVHHLAAPRRAETLARSVLARVPDCSDCVISEVGPTVGAHTGPGTVGVVVLPGGWGAPDPEAAS
ncbi:DegV family protein [Actinopolyspora halophila]|uniref:DegV family protein n=1 Tax=Actinopolyspora halophila TaxID=1850 RepID=UPI00038126BB|nr:DegV family protein [Actinopolyspora halophila]